MLKKLTFGKLILAFAALGLAAPAFADREHGRGHGHGYYKKHHWKHHDHGRVVVMPPPHAYYAPAPRVYYAPPPVVYAPPAPVYYSPPPAVVYPAPEPSLSLRIRIPL